MEFALQTLRARFPQAIQHLVEAPPDWQHRMNRFLAHVKQAIRSDHSQDPCEVLESFPVAPRWTRAYREFRGDFPKLRLLFDAIAWLELTGPAVPRTDAFEWLAAQASQFTAGAESRPMVDVVATLLPLGQQLSAGCLQRMIDLMTAPICRQPTERFLEFARELSARDAPMDAAANQAAATEGPPSPAIAEVALNIVKRMLPESPRTRGLRGRFIELAIPANVTESLLSLAAWFPHPARPCGVLPGETANSPVSEKAGPESDPGLVVEATRIARLMRILEGMADPLTTSQEQLLSVLVSIGTHLSSHDAALGSRFLAARFYWLKCSEGLAGFHTLSVDLLRLLERRGKSSPWVRLLDTPPGDEVVAALRGGADSPRAARFALGLLDELAHEEGADLSTKDVAWIETFAEAASHRFASGKRVDPSHVRALAKAWMRRIPAKTRCEIEASGILAALLLGDGDPQTAVELLEALIDANYADAACSISEDLHDPWLRRIVRDWIRRGLGARIRGFALERSLLRKLDGELPGISIALVESSWMDRYPSQLRHALSRISALSEDAESIAARIWGEEVVSREACASELAAISARLTELAAVNSPKLPLLQRRCEILRQRMDSPPTPTLRQVERIMEKLNRRADELAAEQHSRACLRIIEERLKTVLGTMADPAPLLSEEGLAVLDGILALDSKSKQLGLWVLRRYLDDPRTQFLDQPANADFVRRLQTLGIDPEPWTGDDFRRNAVGKDGAEYTLRFACDVLDVLCMGAHFQTCLSPGNQNFFSVLANAVDINKRVLYGRRNDGSIVGRCLFTLSDRGRILTYHRYTHQAEDQFADATDRFAADLAAAMRTRVDSKGQVPRLVARNWYDDGPMDTEPGNPYEMARLLGDDCPVEAWRDLEARIQNDGRLVEKLHSMLSDNPFWRWPPCLRETLERIGLDPATGVSMRLNLAFHAERTGLPDIARRILKEIPPQEIFAQPLTYYCHNCRTRHLHLLVQDCLELLCQQSPSMTLRLIRRTRERGIRLDDQETDSVRRAALTQIHHALGRVFAETT